LSWTPNHTTPDVRACFYGVAAWRALAADPPWDVAALTRWLRARQSASGGFRFDEDAEVDCMWATYRAVGALDMLGERPERSPVEWILAQRVPGGAFVRWPGYPVADVWASFCAVGALSRLGGIPDDVADAVEKRLTELACAGGGFTYREPDQAADALTVAAEVLGGTDDPAPLRRWLAGCRLPNEGGVMYMPGRGAELRCTMWALAAGAFEGDESAYAGIGDWLSRLQNPDGGFGFWHGRGSDLVSTASAVGIAELVGRSAVDVEGLHRYLAVQAAVDGLRPGLQSARILAFAGRPEPRKVAGLLDRHRVRGGGWAAQGNRMPDLLSTYEATLSAGRFGIPADAAHLSAFLDRTSGDAGVAWTPLAPPGPDPLARCLHRLLRRRAENPAFPLPPIALS
jgi:prenyltransferase beta subunit